MSTVKDLNSILSEIFAGNPISNRSSIKSEICEFSLGATPNSMNWSADQSEILSQSQLRPKPEKVIEKKVLVKKSVNKNILLTKFKPSNFLNGFRGHAKDDKKVIFLFHLILEKYTKTRMSGKFLLSKRKLTLGLNSDHSFLLGGSKCV